MKRKRFSAKGYDKIVKSTREYYDESSSSYVKFYKNWSNREGEFSNPKYREGYETVANILNKTATSGEKVVDVGCGVGVWSTLLAEKGVCITSVDNLLSMLQKLAERTKKFELEFRMSPVSSDGFHLPFRNEVFDGATLNWVLAHIPVSRNIQFMKEISRVVKPNGWLFISDSYWRGQQGGKEQTQVREMEGKEYEVYKYYYEPSELKRLIEKTFGKVELLQPLQYELICVAEKQ